MQAVTRTAYGSPDVLHIREVAPPTPKANEVLIRVRATTVNRTDCGILWGKPFIIRFFTGLSKPKLTSTGTDFAGDVEAIGQNVTQFKVGDRVWGFDDTGLSSHAQYLTLSENGPMAHIPKNTSYEEAAASAEGAHYAYNFINKVDLKPGDQVLINGATGAIGSAMLQLVKNRGAQVTVTGNTKNLDLLRELGADRVIDYTKEDFTQDTEQYNYVFDAVGKSTFAKCKPLLLDGGVYQSSELGPGAQNVYLPLLTRFSNKKVIFPIPGDCKRSILLIKDLIEQGEFQPVIDRIYPMEEIRKAFVYVASGQKTGNVVIRF